MKQKLITILIGLLLGMTAAVAQNIEASGVVIFEDDGQPVIGASVRVVGQESIGRNTDIDGKFKFDVPAGSTLRVSYVGMTTVEVKARKGLSITLRDEQKALDEVMVVAFGTATKSAFTGSAAVVRAEDINKVQVTNALDALDGKAAGVQLMNISGQPGQSSPSLLVRGISSISAANSPLIIVDGAPFSGDMNTLSNQDIESMTVLKDAASAALYGARGANGVIIITTKNSKRTGDKNGNITLDAKWGCNSKAIADYNTINSPAKYYEMWYAGLHNYATDQLKMNDSQAVLWANANLTAPNSYGLAYNVYNVPQGEYMIGTNGRLNPNATLGNVYNYNGQQYMLYPDNWMDEIYGTGLRQEYTLTANAAGEKATFYASVNYMNNQGITRNSDYNRLSGRLKADYLIKPWLKVGANVNYAHYQGNYMPSDGASGSSDNIFSFTQMAPIYPVYVRDGQGRILFDKKTGINSYDYGDGAINGIVRPMMMQANPLSSNQLDVNRNEGNAVNATGFFEVRFLDDFKFTSTNTISNDEARFNTTTNPYFGQYTSLNGFVAVENIRTHEYNLQQLLSWGHVYDRHDIEVMVGHEYYRSQVYNTSASRNNVFDPSNVELAGATTNYAANSYTTDYNVEGWFGRAQYNYGMKYFGSVSFRRDGSSRFHPNHRWGNFWSAGAAWRIGEEKWLKPVKWISELKLKASFGQQGNDQIGDYQYTNKYQIGSNNGLIALIPTAQAGNEYITWETGTNFNCGLEFSLWRSRLSGGIEYFYRNTSDMLYSFPMAPSWGYTNKYYNVGDMRNNGVEVELSADLVRTRDITWSLRANLTHYVNKITSMPVECQTMTVDGYRGYVSGIFFYGTGQSTATYYLPRYAGVDSQTGMALYYKDVKDASGNITGQTTTAEYTEATYHLCGGSLPQAYGGFGTNLSYKGLSVGIDFSYQLGGQVYDYTYANQMSFARGAAFNADLLDAWTPQHTSTSVPRMQFNDQYTAASSDRFLTKADYLCLHNVNISYALPARFINKLHLQQLRVYANGDNLWLWSKRQGLDPRQGMAGGTAENYAPVRTISGGVTLTF